MKRLLPYLSLAILLCPVSALASFNHFRAITLEQEQVPSTLTDFTVLICANGAAPCDDSVSGLNQSGGGAHVTQSDGDDIVFGTTSDCSSLLSWELERYVAATGEIIAWVKIASLNGSTDTTIYMCYGDSGVTTFQGGSLGSAWNSAYKAVLHLPDGSSLSGASSTTTTWDASLQNTPTATTGKIGGSVNFVAASSQRLAIDGTGSGVSLGANNVTLEAWVYSTDFNRSMMVIEKETVNNYWQLFFNGSNGLVLRGGGISNDLVATAPSNSNWHHIVGTISGTAGAIYIDGSATSGTVDAFTETTSNVNISSYDGSNFFFDGKMDEVRISNVARSADWVTTTYNNQSDPQNFVTFGTEDGGAASPTTKRQSGTLLGVQ